MSIVESVEPKIQKARVTSDAIVTYLVDGRVVSVPLARSWRLSEATAKQRARFKLVGDGQGVHWPEIDEDISVEGMLRGVPAHRPQNSARLSRSQANGGRASSNKRVTRRTKRGAPARPQANFHPNCKIGLRSITRVGGIVIKGKDATASGLLARWQNRGHGCVG